MSGSYTYRVEDPLENFKIRLRVREVILKGVNSLSI